MDGEERSLARKYLGWLFYLAVILGLDPCICKGRPLSLVPLSLFFMVVSGNMCYVLYTAILRPPKNEKAVVYFAVMVCNSLATATVLFASASSARKRLRMLTDLSEWEERFRRLGGDLKEVERRGKKRQRLMLVICLFIPYSLFVPSLFFLGNGSLENCLRASSRLLREVAMFQFIWTVDLLGLRFEAVNLYVRTFKKKNWSDGTKFKSYLVSVNELHRSLREMSLALNSDHGLQIVLVLLVMGATNTNYASLIATFDLIPAYEFFFFCIIVMSTIHLTLLIYTCETTCNLANKTPVYLHELGNIAALKGLESYMAMSCMNYSQDKVYFHALGFVPLNVTLFIYVNTPMLTYVWYYIKSG